MSVYKVLFVRKVKPDLINYQHIFQISLHSNLGLTKDLCHQYLSTSSCLNVLRLNWYFVSQQHVCFGSTPPPPTPPFYKGSKILWRSSMQLTRCWRTEVSGEGKNCKGLWPTRHKFSTTSTYLHHGVYTKSTLPPLLKNSSFSKLHIKEGGFHTLFSPPNFK